MGETERYFGIVTDAIIAQGQKTVLYLLGACAVLALRIVELPGFDARRRILGRFDERDELCLNFFDLFRVMLTTEYSPSRFAENRRRLCWRSRTGPLEAFSSVIDFRTRRLARSRASGTSAPLCRACRRARRRARSGRRWAPI